MRNKRNFIVLLVSKVISYTARLTKYSGIVGLAYIESLYKLLQMAICSMVFFNIAPWMILGTTVPNDQVSSLCIKSIYMYRDFVVKSYKIILGNMGNIKLVFAPGMNISPIAFGIIILSPLLLLGYVSMDFLIDLMKTYNHSTIDKLLNVDKSPEYLQDLNIAYRECMYSNITVFDTPSEMLGTVTCVTSLLQIKVSKGNLSISTPFGHFWGIKVNLWEL